MEAILGLLILAGFVAILISGMYFIGARPELVIAAMIVVGVVGIVVAVAT